MAEGKYVSLSGGTLGKADFDYGNSSTGTVSAAYKAGSQFSAAYGQKLQGNWRGEVAIVSSSQDIEKSVYHLGATTNTNTTTGGIKVLSLWANGYYDFAVKGPVKPYLGGGVGVTKADIVDGIGINDSATTLGVQAMAGVNFEASKQFDIFAEARYTRQGRYEITLSSSKTDVSLDNAALIGGVRIKF